MKRKLVSVLLVCAMAVSMVAGLSLIHIFITIAVLFILGVSSIREFAFPLMVGIICGGYTSVCITGALWYVMKTKLVKKEK